MKYLINTVETYRVATVDDVETLHEQLKQDSRFTIVSFSYKTKQVKQKGEIIDEYQLVSVKKLFNDEKEPIATIEVDYKVEF